MGLSHEERTFEQLALLRSLWDCIFGSDTEMYAVVNERVYKTTEHGLEDVTDAYEVASPKKVDACKRTKDGRKVGKGNTKRQEAPAQGEEEKVKGVIALAPKKKGKKC